MINKRQEPLHATTIGWQDYEIIDSGNAQKLERFGALKLTRFEPQAVWKPAHCPYPNGRTRTQSSTWKKGGSPANGNSITTSPKEWTIDLEGLTIRTAHPQLPPYRHLSRTACPAG